MRALIFDIDNTLYGYDAPHETAIQALTDRYGRDLGLTRERFAALYQAAMGIQEERAGLNCAGIHNRLIRFQILLEGLGRSIAPAPRMAELYWSVFLEHMRPAPGLEECLQAARAAGFVIGVGTNMTADYQFAKLERLDLLEKLDFLVTSEEAGVEKPDPAFFALCARKAGCPEASCVFVGDSLRHDVQGALGAGMYPVWLAPVEHQGETPDGAVRVSTLAELPALLRRMD